MNSSAYIILFSLVLLLGLDLVALAARASFLQINHARLLALREQMEKENQRLLALLPAQARVRASLNLALVLTRFFLASLFLLFLLTQSFFANGWLFLLILFVAAWLLFWLEWTVERSVQRTPDIWAARLVNFVRLIMFLFWPLLAPLSLSSETQHPSEIPNLVTEDELKTLLDAGQEEGLFEKGERRMIYSVFELRDTLAREIMVPRIDVLALDVSTSLADAVDMLLQSGYSRLPIFEETVDNILGLLYAKDLLRAWRESNLSASGGSSGSGGSDSRSLGGTLRDLLRPAYFVPEAKRVDALLAEMQSQRIHMAVVVDEYGGVAGLVTLEDIIEEILGEIQDEYDQGEEAPYQLLKDGTYEFLGRIDLDDFNEIMGSELFSEESNSLGGYIYSFLGHVPAVGEQVHTGNLLLTVAQVSARRIHKVRARWFSSAEDMAKEKESVDK